MRHPASIVLDALLHGLTVELDGYRYRLVDDVMCIIGRRKIADQPEEDVLMNASHVTLGYIVEQAKTLSQDELALIAADIVLTRMGRERVEARRRQWESTQTGRLSTAPNQSATPRDQ